MNHTQLPKYVAGAAVIAGILAIAGVPLGALLPFAVALVCPLMMIVMMRRMHGGVGEEHTGHGCEHDPARVGEQPR